MITCSTHIQALLTRVRPNSKVAAVVLDWETMVGGCLEEHRLLIISLTFPNVRVARNGCIELKPFQSYGRNSLCGEHYSISIWRRRSANGTTPLCQPRA